MATRTLPSLTHSEFPQVFTQAIDQMVARISAHPQLGICSYESGETRWGACDSIPCNQPATVHDLAREQEFCVRHFLAVNRG